MSRLAVIPAVLLLGLGVATLAGCGDWDKDNVPLCNPGATQACVCNTGGAGTQTCQSDGLDFDECTCGATSDAGIDAPSDARLLSDATVDAAVDARPDAP